MPKIRAPKLDTPTARDKLTIKKTPYTVIISPGLTLCYFRNKGAGSWSRKVADGAGGSWMEKIGTADDYEPGDAKNIFSFWQAADEARKRTRRELGDPADDDTRPVNVSEALDRYETELRQNGGDPYNARRVRAHLTPALASRPVAALRRAELLCWRNGLLAKGLSPASINRTRNALRSALELAAEQDHRIKNIREFKFGLPSLSEDKEEKSANVVLDDATVHQLREAAYARDRKLGLLVDVLAETGARPSQAARLTVKDLIDDPVRGASLRMPRSGKGGSRKSRPRDRIPRKSTRFSVPITPALAAVLKRETVGRKPDDILLTRANGKQWGRNPNADYRDDVIKVVTSIGLDPDRVTLYALRHSSITHALVRKVPIRIVAAAHDTSVQQIERTYSEKITEHLDAETRKALLLHPEPPSDGTIVTLAGRRRP